MNDLESMMRRNVLTKVPTVAGFPAAKALLAACLGWLSAGAWPATAEVQLNEENFAQLAAQIKPQAGESRWMQIPWLIDVQEARRKAAAEGKPLFVYSGGGATGIGPC
jgi:hypothetical protein